MSRLRIMHAAHAAACMIISFASERPIEQPDGAKPGTSQHYHNHDFREETANQRRKRPEKSLTQMADSCTNFDAILAISCAPSSVALCRIVLMPSMMYCHSEHADAGASLSYRASLRNCLACFRSSSAGR